MHTQDKKIVRLAMVILFLSLMLVYVLLYQIKWKQLNNINENTNLSWKNILITAIQSWQQKEKTIPIMKESDSNFGFNYTSWNNLNSQTQTWNTKTLSWQISASNWIQNLTWKKIYEYIKILSWTEVYYWNLESIEKLWIKYQYALKDNKNIYYIYLGNPVYDFDSLLRKLWWTTHTLATEQDILKNKLFGDKVVFLNLPEYKDKTVLLLITVNNEMRLIQIDVKTYYKSKTYLQSLFID
jgi:hypothetical protein